TFRSFLTLGDDGQPVCTANVVSCLIHDSSTSSKKLLVFSCSLEYGIKALTIQGGGFDAYFLRVFIAIISIFYAVFTVSEQTGIIRVSQIFSLTALSTWC
ncbi:MAG: hypothetical protein OSJ61_28905, partial [Lachnospiraceae bacterium]|nr:hypothetical protein [Lachnospiraceae bacterium]